MSCVITFPNSFSTYLYSHNTSSNSHYNQPLTSPYWHIHIPFLHMPKPSLFTSLILSSTEVKPTLYCLTSYLIISLLVCLHIHLSIFISTTFIF
uniref:Putative ovule protein n=1 Tax=Solanum chacoense TaxID=4108 RepID=A0A0V0H4D0_SOLCH